MKAHLQTGSVRLYGFTEGEAEVLLSFFQSVRMPAALIAPEDTEETVGALFQLPGFSLKKTKGAVSEEKLILFSGISGKELERLLEALHQARLGENTLKAVVTPHNCQWTLSALILELTKERTRFQAAKP